MAEINYHHLYYFYVVAREGHLTRAAEQLNVSQSALSSQIRLLEGRLGQQLFERRGRALHLTEAGRIALDHSETIFSTGRELVATLQQTGFSRQPLRVGAIATLSKNFQMNLLKPLLSRSDVEIILRTGGTGELLEALSSLQLDLVLTNQEPEADAIRPFISYRVDEQPVSLIGLPRLCKKKMSLSERLTTSPLVLPTRSSRLRRDFDALVSRLGVVTQVAAEIDDMAMMRLMAREGAGIAVIPPIVVKDELESKMLIEVEQLPGITETFFAITVERRFPNPLIKTLFEYSKIKTFVE